MKQTVIYTALLLVLCGCNKQQVADKQMALINDSLLNSLPSALAVEEEIKEELRLNGRIVPDEARQASVYALVSGRISQVDVELGDYVRKGQTLAILKSAEVAGVNNELLAARSNLEIARKSMESYKELYDSKLVPEREYIAAKAEYQKAMSELEKAEQVASITGGENSSYILKSPLNGYVIAKNITNNSEVRDDMAEPLFLIADLSEVWVLADVFEVDIRHIRLGQTVLLHTLSDTEKKYEAKIDKIYNVLDTETRTMKIRASLRNARNEVMPGMFVSVKVDINDKHRAIAIPNDAIVLDDSKKYVVVKKEDKPEIRPVKEIRRIGDKCYVEGIAAGESVFTGSQVFLFEALSAVR